MPQCSKCKAVKPAIQFYVNKRGVLENPCVECRREINRKTAARLRAQRKMATVEQMAEDRRATTSPVSLDVETTKHRFP